MKHQLEKAAVGNAVISVAPMMDWTDRYCRVFHRHLTSRALLHTEMIVVDAVIHGDRDRFLSVCDVEHPIALQLGGSSPEKLARAARIAKDYGFDEINLNVGCPSDRVRAGTFGACLMRQPELVGDCVEAMVEAARVPVTVKCRIGVDDQDPELALDNLAAAVIEGGASAIWVHARKAWLAGLSPKENRDVPPLDYGRVYRLKRARPEVFVGINGGIGTLAEAAEHLRSVDGVMLGRAAYQTPALLADVDGKFYGDDRRRSDLHDRVADFLPQVEAWLSEGGRLGAMVRPLLGLFHGCPGARRWRQILTVDCNRPGAGIDVIERALAAVDRGKGSTALDFPKNSSETGVPRTAAA